jgi:hypothetical protein
MTHERKLGASGCPSGPAQMNRQEALNIQIGTWDKEG